MQMLGKRNRRRARSIAIGVIGVNRGIGRPVDRPMPCLSELRFAGKLNMGSAQLVLSSWSWCLMPDADRALG